MRRHHVQLESPSARGSGDVLAMGHYGRPVLAFPPVGGRAWDFDDNGVVDALSGVIDAGRLKIYCVDGRDADDAPDRAAYETWLVETVLPFVYGDCAGPLEVLTFGVADGAVSAVSLTLRRADLFPVAMGMSGRYDDELAESVARLGSDHVEWINGRVTVVLGAAGAADAAAAAPFAARLADLGMRHEVDLVPAGTPAGWPAWRELAATHIPRFC